MHRNRLQTQSLPQVGVGIQLSGWDHAEIIKRYVDTGKVSETERLCGRARGTIYRHVKKHNLSIKRKGFCDRCRRVKGAYDKQVILTRGVAKCSLAYPQQQPPQNLNLGFERKTMLILH